MTIFDCVPFLLIETLIILPIKYQVVNDTSGISLIRSFRIHPSELFFLLFCARHAYASNVHASRAKA